VRLKEVPKVRLKKLKVPKVRLEEVPKVR